MSDVTAGSTLHPRRANSSYLLSGIAHCARCGSPLFGSTSTQKNKRYTSYLCTRAYRKRDCLKQRIPATALENAVITQLKDTYLRPEYIKAVKDEIESATARQVNEQNRERNQLTKELSETRRQITNISDAIAAAGHTNALLQRLQKLEHTETEYLTRISILNQQTPPPTLTDEQIKDTYLRPEYIKAVKP